MNRSIVMSCFLFATLAACGAPVSDAVTAENAAIYCQRACDHRAECDPAVDADACADSCADQVTDVYRDDAMDQVTACAAALACDADSDICLENVVALPAHQRYESACRIALADCVDTDELETFCETDPAVGFNGLVMLSTPIMDEMTGCFDGQTCVDGLSCIDDILASLPE